MDFQLGFYSSEYHGDSHDVEDTVQVSPAYLFTKGVGTELNNSFYEEIRHSGGNTYMLKDIQNSLFITLPNLID